nr:uncharacterized protein I203_03788 [Kwoniella mangroviensis CBS 8507]OCF67103.1 hypothetical protein I203_03788 [Kwoniella mangroviensis CBS 8507]
MPRPRSRSRDRDRERDRKYRDRSRSRERDRERRHKDRSASPYDRDRDHRRSKRKDNVRDPSVSDEEEGVDLMDMGVKEIGEEDYLQVQASLLKSSEFKAWLKEDRGKYLDEMSSESAHKYFRKFTRRWNDGVLKPHQYHPPATASASENTGYKWSFASRGDTTSSLKSVREDVARSTHSSVRKYTETQSINSYSHGPPTIGPSPSASSSSRPLGPSMPTSSDRQYALEVAQDTRKAEKKSHLRDMYNKADELVPKSGGREGKLEEKRATNAENKRYRDKDTAAGLEMDEGTLMGDEGSFAAAVRAREQAESRRRDRKDSAVQDRRAADSERLMERKAKESATMDMFKALAKERFG